MVIAGYSKTTSCPNCRLILVGVDKSRGCPNNINCKNKGALRAHNKKHKPKQTPYTSARFRQSTGLRSATPFRCLLRPPWLGSLDWGGKAEAKKAAAIARRIVGTERCSRVPGIADPTAAAIHAVRTR